MTQATRSNLLSVDTTLDEDITATQDFIPVASTTNFSTSVVAEIETTNEVVSFSDISSNLLRYSQDFTNAVYSKFRSSITANTTTAPDGTTTASKLVEDTVDNTHLIRQSFTTVVGTTYPLSCFVKSAGNNRRAGFGATQGGADIYDIDNGTIITNASGNATIVSFGDGWYRISTTFTATATSTNVDLRILAATATSANNYQGDGTSGYFIWGFQAEVGTSASTYLPTTSSTLVGLTGVTRGVNGTTAQAASSGDSIQQLPYALLNVDMPVRLQGLSVSSDGTGAGRLTLCDKVGTHLCDVDIPDTKIFDLTFDGGILFPNGIYVANSDNITAYTLYTSGYNTPNLTAGG